MSEGDARVSLTRVKLWVGVLLGLGALATPITWKIFQVSDHEKRLQTIEGNQKWQNDTLWEIRGDLKALRRDDAQDRRSRGTAQP